MSRTDITLMKKAHSALRRRGNIRTQLTAQGSLSIIDDRRHQKPSRAFHTEGLPTREIR